MGIRRETTDRALAAYLSREFARRERAILHVLGYVGEQCLRAARLSDGYMDQTGNLRSSVGYMVLQHGRVVGRGAGMSGGGAGGVRAGEGFLRELAGRFPVGFALVFVAGMGYAVYVSATGRDVLDSAELLAARLVPRLLREVGLG